MLEEFRTKLLDSYIKDPTYRRITEVLEQNNTVDSSNKADLPFAED
jgi:hypothetical protein